jgi:hypothetical protein
VIDLPGEHLNGLRLETLKKLVVWLAFSLYATNVGNGIFLTHPVVGSNKVGERRPSSACIDPSCVGDSIITAISDSSSNEAEEREEWYSRRRIDE